MFLLNNLNVLSKHFWLEGAVITQLCEQLQLTVEGSLQPSKTGLLFAITGHMHAINSGAVQGEFPSRIKQLHFPGVTGAPFHLKQSALH